MLFLRLLLWKFPQFQSSEQCRDLCKRSSIWFLFVQESCDQRLCRSYNDTDTSKTSSGLDLSKIPNQGISISSVSSLPTRDFFSPATYLLWFVVCEKSLDSREVYSYKKYMVPLEEKYKANGFICFIQCRNIFLTCCVRKSQLALVLLLVEPAGSKSVPRSQALGTPCGHSPVSYMC